MVDCNNCGATIGPQQRYCPSCGTRAGTPSPRSGGLAGYAWWPDLQRHLRRGEQYLADLAIPGWALVAGALVVVAIVAYLAATAFLTPSRNQPAGLPVLTSSPASTGTPTQSPTASATSTATASPGTATGSATPTRSGPALVTAAQQAHAVDQLLTASAADRGVAAPAVQALSACGPNPNPGPAIRSLQQSVSLRQQLRQQLDPIPVNALPGGQQLKAGLDDAWTLSLQADQQYLTWAQGIAGGDDCNPELPSKIAGNVYAAQATRAAASFAQQWNAAVARPSHLTLRSASNV